MIRIGEILEPSCVFMDLAGAGKSDVLRTMTDRLEEMGKLPSSAEVHRLLMERENLMTTGVRRGFAFPHAFHKDIEDSFLTIGVVSAGVDFQSLDHEPVRFIFLLLGPPGNQAVHLRILARVSRLTGQPEMLQMMNECKGLEELLELMRDSEHRLTAFTRNAGERA